LAELSDIEKAQLLQKSGEAIRENASHLASRMEMASEALQATPPSELAVLAKVRLDANRAGIPDDIGRIILGMILGQWIEATSKEDVLAFIIPTIDLISKQYERMTKG